MICSGCTVVDEPKKPTGYENTTSIRLTDGRVVAVTTLDQEAAVRAAWLMTWREQGSAFLGTALGPPLILFLLGYVLLWSAADSGRRGLSKT
jgi:hypothetical protein